MTEERVKEIIMRDTMEQRKQLSNFMGEVKNLNETILRRLEDQDKRSAERHLQSEERWKVTEEFIKEMLPTRDGVRTIQGFVRFFKWVGLPTGILLTGGYWLLRKLFP